MNHDPAGPSEGKATHRNKGYGRKKSKKQKKMSEEEQAGEAKRIASKELSTQLLPALRDFLKVYPLKPVPTDQKSHPAIDASLPPMRSEQYGTVLLPLWRQTPGLHPNSEHRSAFTTLLSAMEPILTDSVNILKTNKYEHDGNGNLIYEKAIRMYVSQANEPEKLIPPIPMQSWNCFEWMRISANVAPGSWNLGVVDGEEGEKGRSVLVRGVQGNGNPEPLVRLKGNSDWDPMRVERVFVAPLGSTLEMQKWEDNGEWYLLELFLPKFTPEMFG